MTRYFSDGEYVIEYNVYCLDGNTYHFDDFILDRDFAYILTDFMMQFKYIDTIENFDDIFRKIKTPSQFLMM